MSLEFESASVSRWLYLWSLWCKEAGVMKTVQELYGEIIADDEKKTAFVEAMKEERLGAFLKEHGCDATEEELQEFVESKAAADAPLELSDNELKRVAAGSFVDSVECSHKGNTCNCSNTCIRDCC